VVLAQAIGAADAGASTDRISAVTRSGFTVFLQEEEAADQVMPLQDLGWIALARGGAVEEGLLVARTGPRVTHELAEIGFGGDFDAPIAFLADLQTTRGADTATVRLGALGPDGASVFVEEETSRDAELAHTAETVGYAALETGLIFGFDRTLV
jgi:hypothetical protein